MWAYSSARLERTPDKREVDGSNPSRPTKETPLQTILPAKEGTHPEDLEILRVRIGCGLRVKKNLLGSNMFIFCGDRSIQRGQPVNGFTVCSWLKVAVNIYRQLDTGVPELVFDVGQLTLPIYQQ